MSDRRTLGGRGLLHWLSSTTAGFAPTSASAPRTPAPPIAYSQEKLSPTSRPEATTANSGARNR